MTPQDKEFFQKGAKDASALLKNLGNEYRLLILCLLIEHKEMSVTEMMKYFTISQSAFSQHLARLRQQEVVHYRREAQTLYYYIKNHDVDRIIATLKNIYCP